MLSHNCISLGVEGGGRILELFQSDNPSSATATITMIMRTSLFPDE
jgi:hypothetical protein